MKHQRPVTALPGNPCGRPVNEPGMTAYQKASLIL